MTVIVNCSALNDNEFTGTPEEYMEQFAGFVSESEIKDFTAVPGIYREIHLSGI